MNTTLAVAFGLAAAGGVGGLVLNTMGQLKNFMGGGVAQDPKSWSPKHNVKAAVVYGALAGAAIGFGACAAYDAATAPVKETVMKINGSSDCAFTTDKITARIAPCPKP